MSAQFTPRGRRAITALAVVLVLLVYAGLGYDHPEAAVAWLFAAASLAVAAQP